MTQIRDEIRAILDPAHTEGLTGGGALQLIGVVMSDQPPVDEHCPPWRPPCRVALRPDEARRLAAELLAQANRRSRR